MWLCDVDTDWKRIAFALCHDFGCRNTKLIIILSIFKDSNLSIVATKYILSSIKTYVVMPTVSNPVKTHHKYYTIFVQICKFIVNN